MSRAYTCCECDRRIIAVGVQEPPLFRLCNACTILPGWFRDPKFRALLDPCHDGRERVEKPESAK